MVSRRCFKECPRNRLRFQGLDRTFFLILLSNLMVQQTNKQSLTEALATRGSSKQCIMLYYIPHDILMILMAFQSFPHRVVENFGELPYVKPLAVKSVLRFPQLDGDSPMLFPCFFSTLKLMISRKKKQQTAQTFPLKLMIPPQKITETSQRRGLAAHVQRHDDVHDGQRLRQERAPQLHHGPQGLGLRHACGQCEQGGQHEVEGEQLGPYFICSMMFQYSFLCSMGQQYGRSWMTSFHGKRQRISPEPWGPGLAASGKGGWRGQFLLNIARDGSYHERQHTHTHMYSKPK